MSNEKSVFSSRQLIFKELFVGTLIYAVVLGFFDDYSSMVNIKSFSTIFFASFILSVLTFFIFLLKKRIVAAFKDKNETKYRVLMVFCVWFVLFISKFVFIWSLSFIFGSNVYISGFFAILILALCVTIVQKIADYIFIKLK